MAGLLLPRGSWGEQKPPVGTQLDRGHPLAQGLIGAWLFNEGGGRAPQNAATARPLPTARTVLYSPRGGGGLNINGTGAFWGPSSLLTEGPPYTIVAWHTVRAVGTNQNVVAFSLGGGAPFQGFTIDTTGSLNYYDAISGSVAGPTAIVGRRYSQIVAADTTTARRYYVNGKPFGTATGSFSGGTDQFGVGSWTSGSDAAFVDLHGLYLYRRALSPTEIRALHDAPHQIFAPPVWRRYYLPAVTIQTAAPVADVADGSWLNEAGSNVNLYASVDEAVASSVDYIQSSLSPVVADVAMLRLGPLTDPAVGTGHVLRFRYSKGLAEGLGGDRIDLTATLYRADGVTAVTSTTITDIGAETTATLTLTAAEADSILSSDYAAGLVVGLSATKV